MSPGEFKLQGRGVEIRWSVQETPFGSCLIAVTDRGLCHLAFLNSESHSQQAFEELKEKWPQGQFVENAKEPARTAKMIFGGDGGKLSILLGGTAFQLKVWEALLKIPSGHLASYSDIAKAIGAPGASRAVGTAIGQNSIAYLIPCHRVIRETGELGGYRWGSERKCALLAWESALKSTK
jgi:AraC family transcriptional regulator of adaptative response/methylated-DNA-[protein]-cysteine methyltransferase